MKNSFFYSNKHRKSICIKNFIKILDEIESLLEDVAQLAPEQVETQGNQPEVFGEGEQIDVAQNIEGPSESISAGNPSQV